MTHPARLMTDEELDRANELAEAFDAYVPANNSDRLILFERKSQAALYISRNAAGDWMYSLIPPVR